MTRDQLHNQYGSDPAAIEAIDKFAAAYHLVVTKDERASARLGLGGTVDNLSNAFGVKLFDYSYSHPQLGDFHARTGSISVPAEVGDAITSVFGFNNHRTLRRLPRKPRATEMRLAANPQSRPWFIPTELATIYNFTRALGSPVR